MINGVDYTGDRHEPNKQPAHPPIERPVEVEVVSENVADALCLCEMHLPELSLPQLFYEVQAVAWELSHR